MHRSISVVPFALAFALCAPLLVASSAHALDCGERLVVEGDPAAYVRSVCGEPTSVSMRTESRTQWSASGAPTVTPPGTPPGTSGTAVTVTVQIEIWVYDFGPTRLMEELTFENGILRSSRPLRVGVSPTADPDRPGAWHHHRDAHGHRDAHRPDDSTPH